MELYVGNLATSVTVPDLDLLFLTFRPPRLALVEQEYADGSSWRFCVATVQPGRVAQRAAQRLDGQVLHGNAIEVREFVRRSGADNRREVGGRHRYWNGPERRRAERRRTITTHSGVSSEME